MHTSGNEYGTPIHMCVVCDKKFIAKYTMKKHGNTLPGTGMTPAIFVKMHSESKVSWKFKICQCHKSLIYICVFVTRSS